MLLKTRKPAYVEPMPRSFAALMDVYELNYIRLRQLCPDLGHDLQPRLSQVADGMDLHLQVLERGPYTTTLLLTYEFTAGKRQTQRRSPNLRIRVYHDARQVEVLGKDTGPLRWNADEGSSDLGWQAMQTRWRMNRFLYKWLGFCLRQGHHFA